MKFCFCSIAFRQTGEPLTQIIPSLAKVGYEGIEIWANHLTGDGSDIENISNCLTIADMAVPMISPYFNVTGTDDQWHSTLAAAETSFSYAQALSSPLLRTFTGFVGSDEADEATWRQAISRLQRLCDLAADRQLSLALETHPKTLVDTVPAIHRLLSETNRPNLGLNLDIYHLWERHFDPLWIWDQLAPFVLPVHAKNALIPPDKDHEYPLFHDKQGKQRIDGITSLAHGNMDYDLFIKTLTRDGFCGWVSVEWFGAEPLAAAEHELRWLKSVAGVRDNNGSIT